MDQPVSNTLLLWIALFLSWPCNSSSEIKIAILMQGSDFINVSIVPTFDVNQFDLGDVFISPCRAGTYNDVRDSFCKDCSVCTSYQYEREDCIAIRNRVCLNCTICTDREQEICDCKIKTNDCITGDRICQPLPPTSANITFDMRVSVQLPALKERFLQEGLRTGFVLFLSEYLQHPPDSIVFMYLIKTSPKTYITTFIVNDVYSLVTKRQVAQLDQATVQTGLTNTFGVQSNTFSTVSGQRRRRNRRLLQVQPSSPITLNVESVEAQCVSQGACSRFFAMTNPNNPCESTCVSLPCPPGFTGMYGLCELCPNATFKPSEGNDTCTPCPVGAFSNQGSFDASQCWFVPTTTTPGPTTSIASTRPTASASQPLKPPSTSSGTQSYVFNSTSSAALSPQSTTSVGGVTVSTNLVTSTPQLVIESSSPLAPPTTLSSTPSPGGGGGGGWGQQMIITNNRFFNVTYIQNYFTEWNSGKAGTIQYIIINERRDEWALTMVGILMIAGLFSIVAIGIRVFFMVSRPYSSSRQANGTRSKRKEIPLPIVVVPPSPKASSTNPVPRYCHVPPPDVHHPSINPLPPVPFLEQRNFSQRARP